MNVLRRLLHKLGKNPSRPVVIAHRGASRVAPENTITAFEIAVEQGADAVELDVRLTSDKDLVVMHDDRLGRTTSSMRPVEALTAEEVTSLDAGSWLDREFRGELVPLLSEALTTLKSRAVPLLDVKDSGASGIAAAKRLVEILKELKTTNGVIVVSRHPEVLKAVKRLLPKTPRVGVAASHADGLSLLDSCDGCLVWWGVLGAELVAAGKKSGKVVAPWTVPANKIVDFIDEGADAIVTDDPERALKTLGGDS